MLAPPVRKALEQFTPPTPRSLLGLLALLKKSPEELRLWLRNSAVPLEHKTGVLVALDAEVPEEWVPVLPAFISLAHEWLATAVGQ